MAKDSGSSNGDKGGKNTSGRDNSKNNGGNVTKRPPYTGGDGKGGGKK
jgi:hypothetical protein